MNVCRMLSEAFPCVKCTEFDQSHVVANLLDTNNLKYLVDDFFQSIPPVDTFFYFIKGMHDSSQIGIFPYQNMIAFFIRLVVRSGRLHIFS